MERLSERLDVAQKALKTLQQALAETETTVILRDAAIQRFEYTFEAVWKAGQEFLRAHEGLDVGSPKGTIRGLFQTGHLSERQAKLGLRMVDDRNLTSHTYSEGLSEQIFKELPKYAALMQSCLSVIKKSLKKK